MNEKTSRRWPDRYQTPGPSPRQLGQRQVTDTWADTLVAAVIPCLNEAGNIGSVVRELLSVGIDLVVVADNGSTDTTAAEAQAAGALVIAEPRRGYGYACQAGTVAALGSGATVLVYIDGDGSSRPSEAQLLIAPIVDGTAAGDAVDLVLGSRTRGSIEAGAMPPHQRFGNALTSALMRMIYRITVTDLGPYRAISASLLTSLDMSEMTFGWPTEMMVKAATQGATIIEAPVSWDRRGEGRSKVGGTLKGSALAAYHILRVTFLHSPALTKSHRRPLSSR